MKIRPVGAELFHVDGRTDRQTHDETTNRFSNLCARDSKYPRDCYTPAARNLDFVYTRV